ncbi:site-specific integrase [Erythrobacter colymbi]|uniref:site-specific integrase n=1 Tax=Erythrobacter colymbi TaxID=1161202 RepID=UPI000A39AD52|nr:site-specific integrase [Erythrobacter colymbi]
MPRSAFSNLKRRGAVYWWRRKIFLKALGFSEKFSISSEFSLLTKELDHARGRSAAMTAYSERLRMNLRTQVAANGLDQETAAAIFVEEMRAYRNELVHLEAAWKASPVYSKLSNSDDDLAVFQCLWQGIANDGLGVPRDWSFVERHFPWFPEPMKVRIRGLLRDHPGLSDTVREAAIARLNAQGLEANAFNTSVAADLVVQARAAAAEAVRKGNQLIDTTTLAQMALERAKPTFAPIAAPAPLPSTVIIPAQQPVQISEPQPIARAPRKVSQGKLTEEEARFAAMTPTEFVAVFVGERYGGLEHRVGTKRPTKMVGDSTIRDLHWAALLLEKTIPAGLPFSKVTYQHYVELDGWFDRLPVTIGKSPSDKDPATTLQMIADKAIDRIVAGEMEADQIGLTTNTTNKHWHNIKRMQKQLCALVPGLTEIDASKFITPDDRDSREARDKLSNEQAKAIFSLPPWTGCHSVNERLDEGSQLYHDGLFFVLLLVWYTGARREEICKLKIDDIFCDAPLPYIYFRPTSTGGLKTTNSKRKLPVHRELLRLGFLEYVRAMQDAGETLLFPELYPSGGTKRAVGDVFYKIWWIYIRPFVPDLKRGQAMHAARHSVSDALKQAGIDLESRNDLLGHSQQKLGDGAATYSEPVALARMMDMLQEIPVVTDHLPDCVGTNLLPDSMRIARPARAVKPR